MNRKVAKRDGLGEEDAADLKFGSEFQESPDCKPLLISEVRALLDLVEHTRKHEGFATGTSDIKQKTMEYCQRFSRFSTTQTIKDVRQLFPEDQFHQYETAQLANLGCETVEEAKSLIQSFKRFDPLEDHKIQDLLDQMSNLRKY